MLMMLNIQILISYFSQKCSMITYFLFLNKFLIFLKNVLFSSGCSRSWSLPAGFLWLQRVGAALAAECRLLIAVVAPLVEHRL